jgi:uncharacterized protein
METRFILDVHLGKLARMLRMTGFDSLYRNDLEDEEIIREAIRENRVVLTRDRGILRDKRVERGYFVASGSAQDQLREVISHFQLEDSICFLCRCMVCNGTIAQAEKSEVAELVKPDTLRHYDEFFRCRDCGRVYWEGSHYRRMMGFYERLREEFGQSS